MYVSILRAKYDTIIPTYLNSKYAEHDAEFIV